MTHAGVKQILKRTPLWRFARWLARGLVHCVPLSACRTITGVPGLGLLAYARLLAQESLSRHFFLNPGNPGKRVDLVPGLNARIPEALVNARKLLPHVPQKRCSILEFCHVLKGAGRTFSGERVAVVAHWDPDNRIDPFVDYYLRHLQEAGFMTILTSAAFLEASEDDMAHADAVVCRTCDGYDFTSWKGALERFPSLQQARELVFTNDSVFAPLADIGAVHAVMDTVACDFWGLMESRDQLPAMPSFYMVFRQAALRHPCFETFWADVDMTMDKDAVVWRFEAGQALWYALNGLIPGAYIHWDMLPPFAGGPAYVCWKQLVQQFGVPCIKRTLVNGDVWWADATGWEDVVEQAGYPIRLIHDFLARYREARK